MLKLWIFEYSKKRQLEFLVYLLVLLLGFFIIFYSAYNFSQGRNFIRFLSWLSNYKYLYLEVHAAFPHYKHRLSSAYAWLGTKWIDLSDGQYSGFRRNIPTFSGALAAFVFLGHLGSLVTSSSVFRKTLLVFSGFAFVFVLHGSSVLYFFGLILGNFAISRLALIDSTLPLVPVFSWLFCLGSLALSEYLANYKPSHFISILGFLVSLSSATCTLIFKVFVG